MKSILKRLLAHLHAAVFDKNPYGRPALRVNHPMLPASWSVIDDTLTVTAGDDIFEYDLASRTVAQLAAALEADGFLTGELSPDFSALAAAVLIESTTSSVPADQEPAGSALVLESTVDFAQTGNQTIEVSLNGKTVTASAIAPEEPDSYNCFAAGVSNSISISDGQRWGVYYKPNLSDGSVTSYGYYTGFADIAPDFSTETPTIPAFWPCAAWRINHTTDEAVLVVLGDLIGEDYTDYEGSGVIPFAYDSTTEFCLAYEDDAGPYGTLYFYTSGDGLVASHAFTQPHPAMSYFALGIYSFSNIPFSAGSTLVDAPIVEHTGVNQIGLVTEPVPVFVSGPALLGFTNLVFSFFGGYGRELRIARQQVPEALKQMVIPDAEDEWLDLHGALYDVPRQQDESDAALAPRIPQEAFRKRINALAIEQAVLDITGKDIILEEPWGSMFRLDVSALSGGDGFYNGGEIGYHILRPVSYVPITWDDVLPVIERNRAAGVMVLAPETRIRDFVDASIDGTVLTSKTAIYSEIIPAWDANRLSAMVLSGEVIARNYSSLTETRTYSLVMPDPAGITSESSEITGYTWLEMGGWLDVPWSISETEMEALLAAPDGFSDYVNFTLPGDMP